MTQKTEMDQELDALFSAARADAPEPSQELMARVLAQAVAAQPQPQPVRGMHRRGWRARLADLHQALGGWPAMGGLATACAAGVWLGFAPPADWADPVTLVLQNTVEVDMFHGEDLRLALSIEEG